MDSVLIALVSLVFGLAVGGAVAWFARGAKSSAQVGEWRGRAEELRLKLEQIELERREGGQQQQEVLQRLAPLQTRLEQMQDAVHRLEKERGEQFSTLQEQMRQAQLIQTQLSDTTRSLAGALNDKQIRGSWGEISLRRLLEHAGLLPHVDFQEQLSAANADGTAIRIDAVVNLPDGKSIAIDAKVPLNNLQRAVEISELGDESQLTKRKDLLKAHCKDVRARVDEISKKEYFTGLENSPEFTLMFIPSESVLSLTLEADPDLLNYAFEKKIAIVSPVSFFTSMKTIAYSWQQTAAESTIRELMELGRKLYKNLRVMAKHTADLGSDLKKAVKSYNGFIASMERNLLTSMRELDKKSKHALSSNDAIPMLTELEESTNFFVKPELVGADGEEVESADNAGSK